MSLKRKQVFLERPSLSQNRFCDFHEARFPIFILEEGIMPSMVSEESCEHILAYAEALSPFNWSRFWRECELRC